MKIRKQLLIVLALAMMASTLINHDVFGSPSTAAYFFYVVSASLLSFVTAIIFIKSDNPLAIARPLPVYLFLLLTLYYIIQAFFLHGDRLEYRHIFLLVNCLLLLSLCILLGTFQINMSRLYKAITLLAGLEALVCLMQYAGWMGSKNGFFPVTGTWVNPNVSAMFLAMAIPAVWSGIFGDNKKNRIIHTGVLLITITVLFVLKCRTAVIGTAASSAIIFIIRFGLIQKLKDRFSTIKLSLLFASCIAIFIPLALYLYQIKKASADGRMLIWKLSLKMMAQKPLAGYGYGRFEHDYNLFQSDYFANGLATKAEMANASFVHMSYSEFMENAVEGGFIGLLLFTGLLVV